MKITPLTSLRRALMSTFSDGAAWATADYLEVHNPTPPAVQAANRDRINKTASTKEK